VEQTRSPRHGTAAVGQGQPVANTTLIYIVDVSGSTANPTGGTSCPRQNVYDLQANTTLDCELLVQLQPRKERAGD